MPLLPELLWSIECREWPFLLGLAACTYRSTSQASEVSKGIQLACLLWSGFSFIDGGDNRK